jgi:hypothetical protein
MQAPIALRRTVLFAPLVLAACGTARRAPETVAAPSGGWSCVP